MLNKLVFPALALCSLGSAEVIELKTGDDIQERTAGSYDFAIISFFKPSEEASVEVNGMMAGAESYMNEMIKTGDWSARNVGWFSVDIEAHPDIKLTDEADQMVMSKEGLRRMIHFAKIDEDKAANEKVLAMIVRELSGDWLNGIACEDIQKEQRWYYDQVVYFGSATDLEAGGKAANLNEVSMIDRYEFDEQRIGYFYNTDPECRKARDLDEDKNYVVFFNGEESIPYILEVKEEGIETSRLLYENAVRAVNGTPMWGSRAKSAVFEYNANALIYMTPEQQTTEEMTNDWRFMLMVRVIEMIQENDTSFVPILTPHKMEPEDKMLVPQLSETLGIMIEETPNFWVLNPFTEQVVMNPEPLDDINNFSPELILLWARRTVLYLEIEAFEQEIAKFDKIQKNDPDKVTEEMREKIDEYRTAVVAAEEELEVVKEKYDIIQDQLSKQERNEFAERYKNKESEEPIPAESWDVDADQDKAGESEANTQNEEL